MPDDATLATILATCDLMKNDGSGVESAIQAYEGGMKDMMAYRRAKGIARYHQRKLVQSAPHFKAAS